MAKGNVAGLVVLVALVGCIGGPEATTESRDAADSVARKMLFLSPGAVYGWAGSRRAFGLTQVLYQDDFQVTVQSDLIVFSPIARGYGYDGRSRGLRWSILKLDAKQEGLGQRIKTDLGLVVFHRPAGSRQAWRPLVCGDVDPEDLPRNGLQFFQPDTVINMTAQTVKTENGLVMFRDCGIGAQRGGASNAPPEFAAYVITRQNWFNMEGEFRYKLEASCDRADCPRDDTNYQADGVILDYPGAASWQDPYGDRGYRDGGRDDRRGNDAGRERCDNAIDDDGDFMTDCTDPDCAGQWNGRSYCQNDPNRGRQAGDTSCQCWDDEWQEWTACSCEPQAAGDESCECWDDEWEEWYACSCAE